MFKYSAKTTELGVLDLCTRQTIVSKKYLKGEGDDRVIPSVVRSRIHTYLVSDDADGTRPRRRISFPSSRHDANKIMYLHTDRGVPVESGASFSCISLSLSLSL